jgi:hypothetical protein
MFWKKKPRKTAIRFLKIYDGIDMHPKVVSAPPEVTEKTLKDIVKHPKRYAFDAQQRDGLACQPRIKIAKLETPEYVAEHDIDIVAEVTYLYDTPPPPRRMSGLGKLLLAITIWFILGSLVLIVGHHHAARKSAISAACYYFTRDGVPNFIEIDGIRYNLNPDGSIDEVDNLTMGAWHRQVVAEGKCIRVDSTGRRIE